MRNASKMIPVLALTAICLVGLTGCRDRYPHSMVWQPGDLHRSHGEPAEGGYYTDWDPYAAEIEVKPVTDVNPVRTQHVLVATVKDAEGMPLPQRRVEWIITDPSVGAFVEVDESGWRASRGHKVTNNYAITHTNTGPHVLTRGNDDPSDDVVLETGQSWAVITSAVEGTTHVVAYAPGIYNWDKHKVFVTKHWYDVTYKLPPDAVNRIGAPHTLTTMVMTHSDGKPLAGYQVNYKILSGPAAMLEPGGGQTASVKTNASGQASVTLKQRTPTPGMNEVEVEIVKPAGQGKEPLHVHTGKAVKTWLAPGIAIRKTAPATAMVGQTFTYNIVVTSPGKVAANNVVVTDQLPEGIQYVDSSPKAAVSGSTLTWRLGSMAPGASKALTVNVKGNRTGEFVNPVYVKADDGLSDKSQAVTVIKQAKLALSKEGPAEALICDTITYTLKVTNTGDASATNVRIEDTLPDGMKTTDGRSSAAFAVQSLPAGQSRSATVKVRASRTGTFTNKASATGDGGLTADAMAKTIVRQPMLKVSKAGPSEQYVGRPGRYTITVENTGDAEARNTVLTDMLPNNMEFVSASGGGSLSGARITWSLGTIAAKASKQVTLSARATRIGAAVNRVMVEAYCTEASAQMTTNVKGIPAILLETVDVADPIEVGANTTYVITVTNQGSAVGTNIKIVCILPAQQDYVSATGPTSASVDGKTVTFASLASLAPKAQTTYRVVAKGTESGDARFKVQLTSDQLTVPVDETESTNIYE